MADLLYDPDIAAQRRALQGNLNTQLQQWLARMQGYDLDYSAGVKGVETERPNAYRRLLNNFAGRGMARSSGYGINRGQADQAFGNQLSQLETARSTGQADIEREKTGFNANYEMQLADYAKQQADRNILRMRQKEQARLATTASMRKIMGG